MHLTNFIFFIFNSLMAKTIKNKFPKQNSYKQIVEFDNNLFIFYFILLSALFFSISKFFHGK